MTFAGRLGVALTGGSCRCAFQAGVLEGLYQRGVRISAVSGVSSGAWNAAAVAAGSVGRLREMWLGASRFPVYSLRNLAFNKTPFNYLWMHHHFTRTVVDFDAVRASPVRWFVALTAVSGFRSTVFNNREHPHLDPFALSLATNTLPPIYPWPARIEGRFYVDGGFTNNAPYEPLVSDGCDVVLLIANNEDGSLFKSLRDRRHVVPENLRARVRLIHPRRPLRVRFNDLDRTRIEEALDHGREIGATISL